MIENSTSTGAYAATRGVPGQIKKGLDAQHDTFGGIRWGSAFFGWLSANGLAVISVAFLTAGGVAVGLTRGGPDADTAENNAGTIGIAGAIAVLVILALAYFAGGYVAARMARFDGARQGVAVWIIGLVVVVVLAALGLIFGAKYNVTAQLNLPRIPIREGTATTGAAISLGAVLVVTLIAAVAGGKTGEHYHRKVDRAGFGLD